MIDEIENAGIKKKEAVDALTGNGKIVLIVPHDPVLALMTSKRIVMKNGGMHKLILTNQEDLDISRKLNLLDNIMLDMREKLRHGEAIRNLQLEKIAL